jgi:hypothetical protein
MAYSPKENEERLDRVTTAWERLAPEKSFGGMTLAQFRTATEPSRAARRELEGLDARAKQLQAERDHADEQSLAKTQLVINGVLADPTEGADSALYEALGYTRKSERKSGLTRRGNKTPAK